MKPEFIIKLRRENGSLQQAYLKDNERIWFKVEEAEVVEDTKQLEFDFKTPYQLLQERS